MGIVYVKIQPGAADGPNIYSAYRPIIYLVEANAANGDRQPPVVYCDIYFNGTFYKTRSLTQYEALNATSSDWKFDISGSCQEFLRAQISPNGGTAIMPDSASIVGVQCFFRSSYIDANGFITPEGIAPIQKTGSKPASAGTGNATESFYVLNAVLQHEDAPGLGTHLEFAKPNGGWNTHAFPLTHRPKGYSVCRSDSDYYPFLYLGDKQLAKIVVVRTLNNGNTATNTLTIPQNCDSVVSNLVAVIQPSDDVIATFDSSGPATQWQWTVTGGTTWTTIYAKNFTISWNDLLNIIVTEAGIGITTEDGLIVLPEDVTVYKEYTLEVRPRCSNGAYGASDTATYTITEPPACPFTTLSFVSKDYTAKTITFGFSPSATKDIELQWRFDFGAGYISNPVTQTLTGVTGSVVWHPPFMADNGAYLVRIRTKCSDDFFSEYTSWLTVAWATPTSKVNLTISNIQNVGLTYIVTCSLSLAVASTVVVKGYFIADASNGTLATFSFICVIPAGATSANSTLNGALDGGVAQGGKITNISPTVTSDGKTIVY